MAPVFHISWFHTGICAFFDSFGTGMVCGMKVVSLFDSRQTHVRISISVRVRVRVRVRVCDCVCVRARVLVMRTQDTASLRSMRKEGDK